jgi:threonine dehydratase
MTPDVRALAEAAERRIRDRVALTPLAFSPGLSELVGGRVLLKLENLQVTGSFKARGAFNKLLTMSDAARRRGVVAASTGNHGAAVAHALRALGSPGIIFVPENAARAKVANIERFGGEVRQAGSEGGATETHARAYADERGLVYISPYNDWDVVAGQATIGVELIRQAPEIDVVVASLGGGGLIGGVASYMKAHKPGLEAWAVSARNSKAMMESVAAGKVVETVHLPTISDGTAGGVEAGAITFDLCRRTVDSFLDVDEDDIRAAMRRFIEEQHQLAEGAAGVALAGVLKERTSLAGKTVAIVICGANIGADALKAAL